MSPRDEGELYVECGTYTIADGVVLFGFQFGKYLSWLSFDENTLNGFRIHLNSVLEQLSHFDCWLSDRALISMELSKDWEHTVIVSFSRSVDHYLFTRKEAEEFVSRIEGYLASKSETPVPSA